MYERSSKHAGAVSGTWGPSVAGRCGLDRAVGATRCRPAATPAVLIVSAHWESAPLALSSPEAGTLFRLRLLRLRSPVLPDDLCDARRHLDGTAGGRTVRQLRQAGDHQSRTGSWGVGAVAGDVPRCQHPGAPTQRSDRRSRVAAASRRDPTAAARAGRTDHRLGLHDPRFAVPATRDWAGIAPPPAWSRDFDDWARGHWRAATSPSSPDTAQWRPACRTPIPPSNTSCRCSSRWAPRLIPPHRPPPRSMATSWACRSGPCRWRDAPEQPGERAARKPFIAVRCRTLERHFRHL